MNTVIDNFEKMVDEINEILEEFLLKHSVLCKDTSGIFFGSGNHHYLELQEAGKQIQARLLEEYHPFNALLNILLRGLPKELNQLKNAEKEVLRIINHQHTWHKTTQEALEKAKEKIQTQCNLLNNLFAPDNGNTFFVPDTNALLHYPQLEKWEFEGVASFTIVLTPTILSELDSLKINHRNEIVRNKAESLIRQIKEFRRRGNLKDGVPLVRGRSTILTLATEPNVKDSLDWLDPTNNDDRFLATIIEVMRKYPRSIVIAISRDINFQNKAEFARIPFAEPPEPVVIPEETS